MWEIILVYVVSVSVGAAMVWPIRHTQTRFQKIEVFIPGFPFITLLIELIDNLDEWKGLRRQNKEILKEKEYQKMLGETYEYFCKNKMDEVSKSIFLLEKIRKFSSERSKAKDSYYYFSDVGLRGPIKGAERYKEDEVVGTLLVSHQQTFWKIIVSLENSMKATGDVSKEIEDEVSKILGIFLEELKSRISFLEENEENVKQQKKESFYKEIKQQLIEERKIQTTVLLPFKKV